MLSNESIMLVHVNQGYIILNAVFLYNFVYSMSTTDTISRVQLGGGGVIPIIDK